MASVIWLLGVLVTSGLQLVASDDMYASIDGLELLIESERKFLDILDLYIDFETERLENMQL